MNRRRVVVAITEPSGMPLGLRLLKRLEERGVESHLVTKEGVRRRTAQDGTWDELRALADRWYEDGNLAARVASGSFVTDGMVVVPCSTTGLAAIAIGFAAGLVERAADVTLKEGRPLVLVLAEAPGSVVEGEHVRRARQAGATILSVESGGVPTVLDQLVDRVLDALVPSEVATLS